MNEDDDVLTADDEGVWYRWRCPHCDTINESENDTRGETVECIDCGRASVHSK